MDIKECAGIPTTEYSETFLQGMVNRMSMSFLKYGKVAEGYPHRVNALESLQLRLAKYMETGNTEYLMDVANFAMIEFMHPRLPNAFFEATDSNGSPGRVRNTGNIDADRNTEDEKFKARLYAREGD